jgi:hypothetical protein
MAGRQHCKLATAVACLLATTVKEEAPSTVAAKEKNNS